MYKQWLNFHVNDWPISNVNNNHNVTKTPDSSSVQCITGYKQLKHDHLGHSTIRYHLSYSLSHYKVIVNRKTLNNRILQSTLPFVRTVWLCPWAPPCHCPLPVDNLFPASFVPSSGRCVYYNGCTRTGLTAEAAGEGQVREDGLVSAQMPRVYSPLCSLLCCFSGNNAKPLGWMTVAQ